VLTDEPARWIASCLVLGLRISPLFTFAPPFNLTRVPRLFMVLFGLGLSAAFIQTHPASLLPDVQLSTVLPTAAMELALGAFFVLILQLHFAALQFAGRTIDIQAGFGLATVLDPQTRAQLPMVGTLLSLVAAAIFFSMNGHIELLRILGSTLDAVPLGGWALPISLDRLEAYISAMFVCGLGVGAAAILMLFLIDLAIAMLARTVPQMNVLILGIQVKSMAFFVVLPIALGTGGALLARMVRLTLEAIPELI
jgi:flagellar biosynthetic protein FliR